MKKYNVVVTDPNTGDVVLNLENVSIKSSSFTIEKPEDKANVVVNANITGLLKGDIEVQNEGC